MPHALSRLDYGLLARASTRCNGYSHRVISPSKISPASSADYPNFVRLFTELGVPEGPPSVERFAEWIAPHALVLRDGDAVLGFAWARPRGDRLHVSIVITDPAHRRQGVARTLMTAVAEQGRAAGFRRWLLNVKPDNTAARALYERCGMSVVLASVSMRIAWADVARIEPLAGIVARPLAPADDARFEDALALSRGEASAYRAPAGRVLVGAEGPDGPVGVVAYDPIHPGAPLLRVRVPGHARALLDAIRPYAHPDHDSVSVLIEGDPALEAMFAASGAEAVMRMLRMEGDIPG
jgi:ribosomal protein S18 acetylase RimI-like enzyme